MAVTLMSQRFHKICIVGMYIKTYFMQKIKERGETKKESKVLRIVPLY